MKGFYRKYDKLNADLRSQLGEHTVGFIRSMLGYLLVLSYPEVLEQMTYEERLVGIKNVQGCLHYVVDELESMQTVTTQALREAICAREEINGQLPHGDPELTEATRLVAPLVFDYYLQVMEVSPFTRETVE